MRDGEPVFYVELGLIERERTQMVADRDALAQLTHVLTVQLVAQLRLTNEDDLQQLLPIGLEVRQQPNLLQKVDAEALGLVDDENDIVVVFGLLE